MPTAKLDTPMSYQVRCGDCDTLLSASANYCKHCGEPVEIPGDDDDPTVGSLLTDGGDDA